MYEYYIVAASNWKNQIQYRRGRLVEYLARDPRIARIFWFYKISGVNKTQIIQRQDITDKIVQIGIASSLWDDMITPFDLVQMIGGNSGAEKILWYTFPGILWQFSELSVWDNIVYDCSDLWYKAPWEKFPEEILFSEERIAGNSKVLFATSEYLADHIRKISGKNPLTIENGVEFSAFQTAKNLDYIGLKNVPSPRIGFTGSIQEKIDLELLHEVAGLLPDISMVLVGPNKLASQLKDCQNIYCFDAVNITAIPAILNSLDVGLLPYRDIEYNAAVSPLKFFEYLACGIPIVGCGVPGTNKYHAEGIYYYTGGTAPDFAAACRRALTVRKDKDLILSRKKLAQEQDWKSKFEQMVKQVHQL